VSLACLSPSSSLWLSSCVAATDVKSSSGRTPPRTWVSGAIRDHTNYTVRVICALSSQDAWNETREGVATPRSAFGKPIRGMSAKPAGQKGGRRFGGPDPPGPDQGGRRLGRAYLLTRLGPDRVGRHVTVGQVFRDPLSLTLTGTTAFEGGRPRTPSRLHAVRKPGRSAT
jgi:hypothetical protein